MLAQCEYRGVVQLMSGTNPTILEDVRRVGERHKLIMRPPLKKPFRIEAIRKALEDAPIDQWPDAVRASETKPMASLGEALERGWLEVWYQPKLNLIERKFAGAEGLVRCRHPELGMLFPSAFLPGASVQELTALTQFVIMTALHDWQELARQGYNLKLAVNAPVSALTDLNLPTLIRANTPQDGRWPGLIIEVTEGEVAKDIGLVHEIATLLRIYGISLSIDDCGEGYSSFARLRELPFAELKLDASFVKHAAHEATNAAICRAVVNLAHSFGALAVAEGLETIADVQALQRMGCYIGQGYVFSRPDAPGAVHGPSSAACPLTPVLWITATLARYCFFANASMLSVFERRGPGPGFSKRADHGSDAQPEGIPHLVAGFVCCGDGARRAV